MAVATKVLNDSRGRAGGYRAEDPVVAPERSVAAPADRRWPPLPCSRQAQPYDGSQAGRGSVGITRHKGPGCGAQAA